MKIATHWRSIFYSNSFCIRETYKKVDLPWYPISQISYFTHCESELSKVAMARRPERALDCLIWNELRHYPTFNYDSWGVPLVYKQIGNFVSIEADVSHNHKGAVRSIELITSEFNSLHRQESLYVRDESQNYSK